MLLALTIVACKSSGSSPTPTISPSPQPSPITSDIVLTEDEKVLGIRIAAEDPRIVELIGLRRYRIGDFLPWATEDGPDTGPESLFGVIMQIHWEEPLSLSYNWPFAIDRPFYSYWASQTDLWPYDEQVFPYTAHGVTGMLLHIDFERQAVVAIQPQPVSDIVRPSITEEELSDDQKRTALAILRNDPQVQALLATREHQLTQPTHWYLKDNSIGAGVITHLSQPESIEADWTLLDVSDSGDDYATFNVRFTAPDVDRLDVLIDLSSEQVVAIVPTNEGERQVRREGGA